MSAGGIPGPGPFRGLVPHDEESTGLFFGRGEETAALLGRVTREGARVTALTGPRGVGKTSLVRAGIGPALSRQGALVLYVGGYQALEQELFQAARRAGAETAAAGESAADHLVRLARTSRGGTLLVLDHLERVLPPWGATGERLGAWLGAVLAGAGQRIRFLMCIAEGAFHHLDRLHAAAGLSPAPGCWTELAPLGERQVAEILEQTARQTGTFFEAGLPALVAADLCRRGPCLPIDLQLCARTLIELRLTSLRRYERSGGADLIIHAFFDRLSADAGGPPAHRLLLTLVRAGGAPPASTAAAQTGPAFTVGSGSFVLADEAGGEAGVSADELAAHTRLPRVAVERALLAFVAHGLCLKRQGERADRFSLAHPAVAARVEEYVALDLARTREARRALRQRVLAGTRLSLPELHAVRQRLGADLDPGEEAAVARSIRRTALHLGVGVVVALGLLLAVFVELRGSYSLDFVPAGSSPAGRVVVRSGRPGLSVLHFLPARPAFGSIVADTGFAATSMSQELSARVRAGTATGALERDPRGTAMPAWLQSVVNGLRPVPRGVALVLLGDPNGVMSLKQAFTDPAARRETLEALAVIGSGRAGEDEILAAALADASAEIRRRGVEVAAAIDRRLGRGAHLTTLRTALADRARDVRLAVLEETATLDPATAAGLLALALGDRDPGFRLVAETAVLALAGRAPGAAADALQPALRSSDAMARRGALALLDQIAARAPAEAEATLIRIAGDPLAPEEARVAVLVALRRTGVAPERLRTALDAAVAPTSSPRLRAAALPLQVRLLDSVKAEEVTSAESKGPAATRATAAAMWGALAGRQPEAAGKALRTLINDPSPEVRIEAARGLGALGRDGPALVSRALLDPHGEVQRAALDAAVQLALATPAPVVELLGRALPRVQPASRGTLVAALGRIGADHPDAVLAPLARALKEPDRAVRVAAAGALCALARKVAMRVSPLLQAAVKDPDREVRTAAAACLGNLVEGDPRGAAHIAADLAGAEDPGVREAAARSMRVLTARAPELTLPALARLMGDGDRGVRLAAVAGLDGAGRGGGAGRGDREPDQVEPGDRGSAGALRVRPDDHQGDDDPDQDDADHDVGVGLGKRAEELERALAAAFTAGDPEERRLVLRTAGALGLTGLIRQAAGDPDEGIRLQAVRSAARARPPVLEVLESAIDDRATGVRAEAVHRLARISGAGVEKVLPIFEAMLRAGEPATRRAGALALGDLAGGSEATIRLLAGCLRQRGEAVRAAAAEALGRIAERDPERASPLLEQALADPAHDVRLAAIRGLGGVWARRRSAQTLAAALEGSETDSARRLVALEALVAQARGIGRGQPAAPPAPGGTGAGTVGTAGPAPTSAASTVNDPATSGAGSNGVTIPAGTDPGAGEPPADPRQAARQALSHIAATGAPLARLAAQVGQAFLDAPVGAMHLFWDRLFGG